MKSQGCFKKLLGCFKEALNVFQECLKFCFVSEERYQGGENKATVHCQVPNKHFRGGEGPEMIIMLVGLGDGGSGVEM